MESQSQQGQGFEMDTHYGIQIFHLFVIMFGLSVVAIILCMWADGDAYRYMDKLAEWFSRVRVRIQSRIR